MTRPYGPAAGPWRPMHPQAAVVLLSRVTARWWVAGGWALDLFLGYQSRSHRDLDIGILRGDAREVFAAMPGWEFFEAKEGALFRCDAGEPRADVHSLWGRPAGGSQWLLELMLDESDGECWVFRREPRIRHSLDVAVRYDLQGIPYLAPEIQLLYKAARVRAEDTADFDQVAPRLDEEARNWLCGALDRIHPAHPWRAALEARL